MSFISENKVVMNTIPYELWGFNDTEKLFRDNVTVQELFEEQVKFRGSQTAVICSHDKNFMGNSSLTFSELNSRSNQLAHTLRKEGVKPDTVIGICAERSFAMIIGIFGIIKAGGAYLPISPENPAERNSYMLSDSRCRYLLVQNKTADISFDGIKINLDDEQNYSGGEYNLPSVNRPEDLIYVIYTSGSTGRPKGVMIEHKSLVNRLSWMQSEYPINENDVILQKTPFYFDVSVWELFWWAVSGAKMSLLKPGGEKIPMIISSAIRENKISVLHFVPSMLNVFLEYLEGRDPAQIESLSSVKRVFSSGEALSAVHVKKFNKVFRKYTGAELVNLYGPTEATVDVSYFNCPGDSNFNKIPIGKPIDNTKFYVIKDGKIRSVGEEGELCISGAGLARGYINNTEMTNEKFTDNPYLPGHKMYRTGDLVRWMSDGNVEYLGRMDHQVKIRGLRIELGEIESVIREYNGVNDCIVSVNSYSENVIMIVAYVVSKSVLIKDGLKNHLKKYLPEYMIPNHFVMLDRIPLLSNGKADRKSLPDPVLESVK